MSMPSTKTRPLLDRTSLMRVSSIMALWPNAVFEKCRLRLTRCSMIS
jgi:hypothetical protein